MGTVQALSGRFEGRGKSKPKKNAEFVYGVENTQKKV
jgi:hypothetical protein